MLLRESESMLRLSVGISISGVERAPRSGKLEIALCYAIIVCRVIAQSGRTIRIVIIESEE